jgi:hypothetical protein
MCILGENQARAACGRLCRKRIAALSKLQAAGICMHFPSNNPTMQKNVNTLKCRVPVAITPHLPA